MEIYKLYFIFLKKVYRIKVPANNLEEAKEKVRNGIKFLDTDEEDTKLEDKGIDEDYSKNYNMSNPFDHLMGIFGMNK